MPVNTDYSNYGSYGSYAGAGSRTSGTDGSGNVIDAVFSDGSEKQVSVDDFLQLMVAQLKNQDFMNPVDDTQYITQLAQFTTMQQMQEMAYNSKTTFLTSLVGKTVVAAKLGVGGAITRTEGVVDSVSFVNNDFRFTIGGQTFEPNQIMEVKPTAEKKPESDDI